MEVTAQMVTAQVVKWLSTGERRLLNWKRQGVLPELNFIGNNGVRHFDREWALPFLLSLMSIIKEGDNDNC